MSQPAEAEVDWEAEGAPPQHGWRGIALPDRLGPCGLTIALSRQAGARGGTIARQAAQRLGWQVYDQELLEFMCQDVSARQGLTDGLPEAARAWIEARLEALSGDDSFKLMARLILELGFHGKLVIIGRGAGYILPRWSTLNVRIIAPLPDRIAYMGQWMRMPGDEAASRVAARDASRVEFLGTYFQRTPDDIYHYDLLLNSSTLGEGGCADLIAHAARARQEHPGRIAP